MSHVPLPTEVENPSGSFTNLADPDPDTIRLCDIAHRLSQVNRFGGAACHPYSVAQHAVFCARLANEWGYGPRMQLMVLHHDDAEAYICDLPKPAKGLFGNRAKSLASSLDAAISKALGVPRPSSIAQYHGIKRVDSYALLVEALQLMPSGGAHWQDRFDHGHRHDEVIVPYFWMGEQKWTSAGIDYVTTHYALMRETFGNLPGSLPN